VARNSDILGCRVASYVLIPVRKTGPRPNLNYSFRQGSWVVAHSFCLHCNDVRTTITPSLVNLTSPGPCQGIASGIAALGRLPARPRDGCR
jgi:hypothetical protein